jgi:prevent-host-death family protein
MMLDTYNIREAQAQLTRLSRGNRKVIIANRNKPAFVAMPVADYEALLETLDLLANPAARKEFDRVRAGRGAYKKLDLSDEGFGL